MDSKVRTSANVAWMECHHPQAEYHRLGRNATCHKAGNLISCARTHGHWEGPALPRRRAECLVDCCLACPRLQVCAVAPIWILPQFREDSPRTTCRVDSSLNGAEHTR